LSEIVEKLAAGPHQRSPVEVGERDRGQPPISQGAPRSEEPADGGFTGRREKALEELQFNQRGVALAHGALERRDR